MTETNEAENRATGAWKTLTIAGLVSVVWLGAALLLGWNAVPCEPPGNGTFGCLKANEWGDYLAGVFAPLAFIWLVATVWIQSSELREQRRELALTRQELADNRDVMKEQAAEARNQAKFIGEQTEIIKSERVSREAEELFNAHVAELGLRLRQYPLAFKVHCRDQQTILAHVSQHPTDQQNIAATVASMRAHARTNRETFGLSAIFIADYPYDLERIFNSVVSCWEASQKLPAPAKIKARALELEEFHTRVLKVLPIITNYPGRNQEIAQALPLAMDDL